MAVKPRTLPAIELVNANQAYALGPSNILATSVTIQADFTNSGKIVIGDAAVTALSGQEVPAGDSAVIEADQVHGRTEQFALSDVYVTSSQANQRVRVFLFDRKP